jgi:LuxR family maltose regulon positive regulatory protein
LVLIIDEVRAETVAAHALDNRVLLVRERLVARLDRLARTARQVVVAAPAGSGKSVLLDNWVARRRRRGADVVLVRFHRGDTLQQVAERLCVSLTDLDGETIADARASLPDAGALGATVVAGALSWLERRRPAWLVVDGLDAPEGEAVVAELEAFVARAAKVTRTVVTRRSATGLSAPHRDVARFNARELAFHADEAAMLVLHVSGHSLTPDQVAVLLARTEGWTLGVQLAAIALRDAADPGAVLEDFGGDDRHLGAYLCDEVLADLSDEERRLLVQTSILGELSGPLCDAVTGGSRGALTLRRIARRNVFVDPCTPDATTFRVHPLLRDLLRRELRSSGRFSEVGLLTRAAAWHATRGEKQRAAQLLIDAELWDQVVALVDSCARAKFERYRAAEVLEWLERVPAAHTTGDFALLYRRALLLTMTGRTSHAESVVRKLEVRPLEPGERLLTEAVRATWAFFDSPPEAAIAAADAVLQGLDRVDPRDVPDIFGMTSPAALRMMAEGSRARARWYTGEVDGPRRTLRDVGEREGGYAPWRVHALAALALLEAWAGNLREGHRRALRALTVAHGAGLIGHPATLDAHLALADVSRERGDFARARRALDDAARIASRSRRPITTVLLAIEEGLLHLAMEQPARGLDVIAAVRSTGDPSPPPVVDVRLRAAEARLHLALGDHDAACAALAEAGDTSSPELVMCAVQLSLARRDLAAARAHFGRLPDAPTPRAALERELWGAILEMEAGSPRHALARAAALVDDARREGHVRLFLDAGPHAQKLLRTLGRAGVTPYVHHVLTEEPAGRAASHHTVAGLSERELEIVRYLPTALASDEIAAQLYISLNTLKTHLRTIYRKLGVHARSEAIARAQALGIA